MPLEREDLEGYVNILRQDIQRVEASINARLDTLNSKTATNTTDIAVIKATQETSKTVARNHGAGWGATLGTAFSIVATLVWQWLFGAPPPIGK